MTISLRMAALAAGLALAAPMAADAATVVYAGESSAGAEGAKSPTGSLTFTFEIGEPLDIESFAISATGTNAGADLAAIRFDYAGTTGNKIASLGGFGTTAFGGASVEAFGPYETGDIITFRFYGTTKNTVRFTISFDTMPVITSVPLPAAGGLLGLALLGGIAASRRRD